MTTEVSSPMMALMRECINTPCRGSDLGSHDLITVVRQELFDSPIRRTAPRSARTKNVSFQESSESPSKSTRRRRRSTRQTPRKPLSDLPISENCPPDTSEIVKKRTGEVRSRTVVISARESELEMKVQDLQDDIEERDQKIDRLTELVKFLSAEVRIYTSSLESQLAAQTEEVRRLKQQLQS